MKNWNKNTFQNIYFTKIRTLAHLAGVQEKLCCPDDPLLKLEFYLQTQYNQLLSYEEELWFLKSRNYWLVLGDRNTSFFHKSTLIRRRRNKITHIQDHYGHWLINPVDIGNEIRNSLITNFCTVINTIPPDPLHLHSLPKISTIQQSLLLISPTIDEIKTTH